MRQSHIPKKEPYKTDDLFINLNDLGSTVCGQAYLYCKYIKQTKNNKAMYKVIILKYDQNNMYLI